MNAVFPLLFCAVLADPDLDRAKHVVDRYAALVNARVDRLVGEQKYHQRRIDRAKKGMIKPRVKTAVIPDDDTQAMVFPSKVDRDGFVFFAEKKIAELEDTLKGVRAGKLDQMEFVDVKLDSVGSFPKGLEVDEIVDEKTMYVWYRQVFVLVKGVPTKGLADGIKTDIPGIVEITKTEKTSRGTVFVAEAFDLERARAIVKTAEKQKP